MPAPIAVENILRAALDDVAAREAVVSFQDVKARSRSMAPPRDARAALLRTGCSVITELTRAVPFKGPIANLESPQAMASLATKLEEVGVHLMACQTERRRFHGSLEDMAAAREATTVPMVCRDVIVDPYQIHEARCYGADVVTLQVAVLEQARLESLLDRTESLGMVALLEVRDPQEVDRAIQAGGTVVGVNAWSVTSDELHREAFADIVPGLPESVIRIAVRGVQT